MVIIYIACSNKNKNNLSAESSTLIEKNMQNACLETDYKRLKGSEMMNLTIEFAIGTSESLSTLTTSNGMNPIEPNTEEINVSIYGAGFNTASS